MEEVEVICRHKEVAVMVEEETGRHKVEGVGTCKHMEEVAVICRHKVEEVGTYKHMEEVEVICRHKEVGSCSNMVEVCKHKVGVCKHKEVVVMVEEIYSSYMEGICGHMEVEIDSYYMEVVCKHMEVEIDSYYMEVVCNSRMVVLLVVDSCSMVVCLHGSKDCHQQ
jgi:hypothetical protein